MFGFDSLFSDFVRQPQSAQYFAMGVTGVYLKTSAVAGILFGVAFLFFQAAFLRTFYPDLKVDVVARNALAGQGAAMLALGLIALTASPSSKGALFALFGASCQTRISRGSS